MLSGSRSIPLMVDCASLEPYSSLSVSLHPKPPPLWMASGATDGSHRNGGVLQEQAPVTGTANALVTITVKFPGIAQCITLSRILQSCSTVLLMLLPQLRASAEVP